MTQINHHISDAMITAYAAGNLSQHFAVVVASHVSMCETCRVTLAAQEAVGGAVLESTDTSSISDNLKGDLLAKLDTPYTPTPVYDRSGIYPGSVAQMLKGQQPRWKALGKGIRQHIMSADDEGSLRLLYIPSGQAVPEHGHEGLELTMVLQGSFSDDEGCFGIGDVEIGDEDLDHTPIADLGDDCICLAATDAPLRFNAMIPRLLQPLFRI